MTAPRTQPGFITLEPDQAVEYCVNLIRHDEQFVVEIDPRLRGMKDVVAISRSAVFEKRDGWTHLRRRAVHREEACQYVVNLIAAEVSFQVNPERQQDGRMEYVVLVETRSSGRKEAF